MSVSQAVALDCQQAGHEACPAQSLSICGTLTFPAQQLLGQTDDSFHVALGPNFLTT